MTDDDIKKIREASRGFTGRFFYDAEAGDVGYIARACDEKRCDCEQKLNLDGEQDCSELVCEFMDDHVGEPMVAMLNAVPALLDEVERLRRDLRSPLGIAIEQRNAALDREDALRSDVANLRAQVEQLTRERDDAYQRGKDDLRAIIDALPGPAVGDDPIAIAKRWNGDSGTREPDFDMSPDDTASFLASHVIEIAAQRDTIKRLLAEALEIADTAAKCITPSLYRSEFYRRDGARLAAIKREAGLDE